METIFVLLIIVAAAVYVFRIFYTVSKKGSSCTCGCDACDTASGCTDILVEDPDEIRPTLSGETRKQLRS